MMRFGRLDLEKCVEGQIMALDGRQRKEAIKRMLLLIAKQNASQSRVHYSEVVIA